MWCVGLAYKILTLSVTKTGFTFTVLAIVAHIPALGIVYQELPLHPMDAGPVDLINGVRETQSIHAHPTQATVLAVMEIRITADAILAFTGLVVGVPFSLCGRVRPSLLQTGQG